MFHRPGFASFIAHTGQRLRQVLSHIVAGALLAAVAATAHAAPLTPPGVDKDAIREAMASALGYRAVAPVRKAGEPVVTVAEYYNAGLQHYFITAEPAEIANLDSGAFGGAWKRTGRSFNAWALATKPADAVPVCRFFGTD